MDGLQTQVEFLQGRVDALEVRLDSMDARSEERFTDLVRRFGLLEADLKKFTSITNRAVLHYADETDKVRDRLAIIEDKLGIPRVP